MAKALTIDETLEKINEIILQMENGNQSLEEALSSYESGIKLIKSCSKQIERVEKKLQIMNESGETYEF